jgi:hypothetical protein
MIGPMAARVGDRRPGHAGEDHGPRHVDVAEPAFQPADRGHGEIVDLLGDPGRVHQVAGHDEEGHGQEREGVDPVHHPMNHGDLGGRQLSREIADRQEEQRGARERHGDRYPDRDHDQEPGDHQRHEHEDPA